MSQQTAKVTGILSNPDQDPHLFEARPSTARGLVTAKPVICNGADYHLRIVKLPSASETSRRKIIAVADPISRKAGNNSHRWYDLANRACYRQKDRYKSNDD